MTQQKLPFDKREFAHRCEAIERMQTDRLTVRKLNLVKHLVRHVFKHHRSSAEGDLTFVRIEKPSRPHQFSLSSDMLCSKRALENWLAWAEEIGVVSVSVDCDSYGERRSTMSLNWGRIFELSDVNRGSNQTANQSASSVDQSASSADQCACSVDQSACHAHSSNNNTLHLESQHSQGERQNERQEQRGGREGGSDEKFLSSLDDVMESVKAELTSLGVSGTSVVDRAINSGVPLHEIEAVIRSAREHQPTPAPQVIFGRIKSLPDNPKLVNAPWPHQIAAVRRLRRADTNHERDKLRRRAAIEAAGATETTASLVNVLDELGVLGVELPDDQQSQVDELERDVGPRWDRLSAAEQDAFAASVLSEYRYQRWKKGNVSLSREQLLEAYRSYCT